MNLGHRAKASRHVGAMLELKGPSHFKSGGNAPDYVH